MFLVLAFFTIFHTPFLSTKPPQITIAKTVDSNLEKIHSDIFNKKTITAKHKPTSTQQVMSFSKKEQTKIINGKKETKKKHRKYGYKKLNFPKETKVKVYGTSKESVEKNNKIISLDKQEQASSEALPTSPNEKKQGKQGKKRSYGKSTKLQQGEQPKVDYKTEFKDISHPTPPKPPIYSWRKKSSSNNLETHN